MTAQSRIALVSNVSPAQAGETARSDHLSAGGILLLAAVYATVRYNVFKGVPWSDWPGYIANKAFAVAGLWLLTWAGWRKLKRRRSTRVPMAWAGCLILSHTLVSLGLFGSGYFGKFFTEGRVNVVGGLSLLAGAGAIALLELGARGAFRWPRPAWLAGLAALLVFSAFHTALPGLTGWFAPTEWPGHLPPLTLLASAPAAVIILLLLSSFKSRPLN